MAIEFPEREIKRAWERAHELCECSNPVCGHGDKRHAKKLCWDDRGCVNSKLGWEALANDDHGFPVASNCLIVCMGCYLRSRGGS